MSKVICDVCGTTFPETASQCPICGCARNTTAQTAAGDGVQTGTDTSYAYVKGGRFSKSTVRKRNKTGKEPERRSGGDGKQPKKDNTNTTLAIIIVVLLLAIVAVLGYMAVRVFFPGLGDNSGGGGSAVTTEATTLPSESTGPSGPAEVPCTALKLDKEALTFTVANSMHLLDVTCTPANTTDTVTYSSSNEAVATVTATGKITAVGGGQAVITVTCGQITVQCEVNCEFGDYTPPTETAPTEAPVQIPEGFVLKLNRKEFSLTAKYPNPWALYKETDGVKATDITWTVDDPSVASVDENGVVSAVGRGWTTVRATIGDQTVTCKVNVSFDPEPATEPKYIISHSDVTLYVGDPTNGKFRITLTDTNGVNVEAEWTVSDEGYVTIDGRNITAVKSTSDLSKRAVTISATVEGVTYSCTVRVVEPEPTETTQQAQ